MLVYWSVHIDSDSFTSISGTFIAQETHPRSTPKFHPLKSPGHFRPWFFDGFNAKKIVLQMCKERMRLVQRNREIGDEIILQMNFDKMFVSKKKTHLCEEGKFSFWTYQPKSSLWNFYQPDISFLKCWASHCFHLKKLICFPPCGAEPCHGWILFSASKSCFRSSNCKRFCKGTDNRSKILADSPGDTAFFLGGHKRWRPHWIFVPPEVFVRSFFFVFSNKKNGDFLFVNPCNLVTWVEEMENELRNINSNCVSVSQKKAHVLRG